LLSTKTLPASLGYVVEQNMGKKTTPAVKTYRPRFIQSSSLQNPYFSVLHHLAMPEGLKPAIGNPKHRDLCRIRLPED